MKAEKNREKKEYSTSALDDGVNYRNIADLMSEMGFQMNHSSARNYVLRVMKKFVEALCEKWNIQVNEDRVKNIAQSSNFQQGMFELLHVIEFGRKNDKKS